MSELAHPRVKGLTSERDWLEWERRLAAGEDPAFAAAAFGRTSTDFRKTDARRHEECLILSREARGALVDRLVENDVVVVDGKTGELSFGEGVSDSMKQFFARRWQPAFAQTQAQIEVGGSLDVFTGVDESLDKLAALIAAAGVRAAAGADAGGVSGGVEPGGEGGARLALAGVAGTREPGSA